MQHAPASLDVMNLSYTHHEKAVAVVVHSHLDEAHTEVNSYRKVGE